jgi:hypothetical protein
MEKPAGIKFSGNATASRLAPAREPHADQPEDQQALELPHFRGQFVVLDSFG